MDHGTRTKSRLKRQRYRFNRQRSRLNVMRGRRAARAPTTRRRPTATRRRRRTRPRPPAGAVARPRRSPVTHRRAPRTASLDLREPLAPVRQVVVEYAEGVVEHRAVRRPERPRPRRRRRGRASARSTRSRDRARRRGGARPSCRGRAPCRRSAARCSAGSTSEIESAVWPGVVTTRAAARRRRSPRRRRAGRRRGSTPGRARARGSPCGDANSAATSEWSKWWWVSSTRPTSPSCSSSRSRCPSSTGPGRPRPTVEAPGSRSTQVLVPSSVIIPGFGASRHRARSPNDPPCQPSSCARCARPAPVAGARGSTASSPRPAARGRACASRRSARVRRDHRGRVGIPRQVQRGEVRRRHHQHLAAVGPRHRVAGRQPRHLGRLRGDVAGQLALGQRATKNQVR